MSSYISYPLESDPDEILTEAYAFIKSKAPAWNENDANLDTWILQVLATEASDLRRIATDVPASVFTYLGATLLGITPVLAAQATVQSTWTMKDNVGYIIPAGTLVTIRDDLGAEIAFQTDQGVIVPQGSLATAAGEVTLRAFNAGAASGGLGGVGIEAKLLDTLEYVTTVMLTGVTVGGEDAETLDEYNDRLATRLRRLSTRPILVRDFSDMTLDIPGVYRAVAIDGYDPLTQTYNNERMIAVSAVDELGNGVGAPTKTAIDAYLEENRETNFVVSVIDPTYTSVDVNFTGKALFGYDPEAVEASVIEQLQLYLDKSRWGRDSALTDTPAGDRTWVEDRMVRYNKMLKIAMNVQGVDYITTFVIGITGQGMSNIDLELPGAAPLATPGQITGSLT